MKNTKDEVVAIVDDDLVFDMDELDSRKLIRKMKCLAIPTSMKRGEGEADKASDDGLDGGVRRAVQQ